MDAQYGMIQVDSSSIQRKYRRVSNITEDEIKRSVTTSYDKIYILKRDCWAICKFLFDTTMIYSQQYEDKYGSSDTIVIDNCGNVYKMYGIGKCIQQLNCNIYDEYIFKTLTEHIVPLPNDVIDKIKTSTCVDHAIDLINKYMTKHMPLMHPMLTKIDEFKTYIMSKSLSCLEKNLELETNLATVLKQKEELETNLATILKQKEELETNLATVLKQKEELETSFATVSQQNEMLSKQNLEFAYQNDDLTKKPNEVVKLNDDDKLQDIIINQNKQIRTLKNELMNYIVSDAVKLPSI